MSELQERIELYLRGLAQWNQVEVDDDMDWIDEQAAFRACIITDNIEPYAVDKVQCGSFGFYHVGDEETPKGLFRLLELVGPKKVSFANMYKGSLFEFASFDGRFFVTVELFKHELSLYFYAPAESIVNESASGIRTGAPGRNTDSDNGWHLTDSEGKAFFDMVVKAATTKQNFYSGNDFWV